MRFKFKQTVLFLVLLLPCPVVTLGQEESRSIEVRVRAVDFDGAPVPGTQVNLGCDGSMVAAFPLDDEGSVVELVEIPIGAVSISASMTWAHHFNLQENLLSSQRWRAYLEGVSFDREFVCAISTESDHVMVEIVGHPATAIEGRIVDENGKPLNGSVRPELTAFHSPFEIGRVREGDHGNFRIAGLRRGAGLTLWCSSNHQLLFKDVGADQTLQDLDLGDLVIPGYERSAELRIGVPPEKHRSGTIAMYTLVPVDGARLFMFLSNYEGVIAESANSKDGVRIPEGRYFILPLFINGTEQEMRLIRDIQAGRHDQVRAAGIPVIEARADRIGELIVDDWSPIREAIGAYGDIQLDETLKSDP